MWTMQALVVLFILLPGFIANTIINSLTPRKKQNNLSVVVESFIFSFLIYLLALIIVPSFVDNALVIPASQSEVKSYASKILPLTIFLVVSAVFLSIFWAFIQNNDLLHIILRKLHITRSTSRSSVWLDSFCEMKGRHVILTLDNGTRIMGYPQIYSNDPQEESILILHPQWIDPKGIYTSLKVDSILITKNDKIRRIEFMNYADEMEGAQK
jgi:hypothetical protein